MDRPTTGRLTIRLREATYQASWRVVGPRVEVRSPELGVESALLGPLASAPGTVAREVLAQMSRRAANADRPKVDRARFDVRDA